MSRLAGVAEDLDRRANRLASHLRALGVGPEVLVGLCVERSLEMLVGILGILKAGGAYVPLDPTYPQERLAFMLEDTGAPVLLTQHRLLPRLPTHAARVLCLDTEWSEVAQESATTPEHETRPASTAYVIYTSGSTGRSKGVQVSHENVARLFAATRALLESDDVVRRLRIAGVEPLARIPFASTSSVTAPAKAPAARGS